MFCYVILEHYDDYAKKREDVKDGIDGIDEEPDDMDQDDDY